MGFIKANWLQLAIIFAAIFIAYFGVWNFGFVYDDFSHLVENTQIHSLSPFSKFFLEPGVFVGDLEHPQNWRPIAAIAAAFSWAVFGNNPSYHHMLNLLFHLLNAALVYWLIYKLFSKRWLGFLVALFFAIHPALTESVTWIASQNNLIWTGLILLSCAALTKNKIWLSALLFGAALLTKETALAGIVVLASIFFITEKSAGKYKVHFKNLWPILLIAVIYFISRLAILGSAGGYNWGTVLIVPAVFWKYVSLIFWPVNLIPNYDTYSNFPLPENIFDLRVLLGVFSGAGLVWLLWKSFEKKYLPEFLGILWFLAGILPVLQIIPFIDLIGERALYFPMIGALMAISHFGWRMKINKYFSLSLLVALVVVSIFLTIQRNRDWGDTKSLWEAALRVNPHSARAYSNLGNYYLNEGNNPQKALELSEEFLKFRPEYKSIWVNLATAHSLLGHYQIADQELRKILSKYPNDPAALRNLERNYQRWSTQ